VGFSAFATLRPIGQSPNTESKGQGGKVGRELHYFVRCHSKW
jgi:hypothetical protein